MEGLDGLEQLDQLYLSHNGIEEVCGLDKNTELTTLDLAGNRIKQISGLDHLGELEDLWCNDNEVWSSLSSVHYCTCDTCL